MNISYKQVEDYCNQLHAIAKNMSDIMKNIEVISNELKNSDIWQGEASNFYTSQIKSIFKGFDEAFAELENSILFMANCAEGYQKIDKDIVKEICTNLNITSPNLSTSGIFNGV